MATAAQIGEVQETRPRDLWKIGDAAVLLVYSGVVFWTLQYHEKWADEAQAWLIARDLDLRTIWFHELRYEGSPGLWHTILWIAQHVFHAGYGVLGYIGVCFAIAGAAILLFFAPFPRYIRWPLAFTYVMVYQYAVIARPYTLFPLLAFLAAIFFKDTLHPERITIVLILLALLTLHGAILAGCLGFVYLLYRRNDWKLFEGELRKKYFLCIGAFCATLICIVIILKPTPDVEEFAMKKEIAALAQSMHVTLPTPQMKVVSVVTGAFLGYLIPSFVFVALVGVWFAIRKKFLVFGLPVFFLMGLYIAIHGYSHHHGTVTVATIMAIWIAWPTESEKLSFTHLEHRALQGMGILLLLFCGTQIWDSGVVIKHEYLFPYSGAEDAAKFLISDGAMSAPIFGYLYGVIGVQPYFDRNIFANLTTSYFHHGVPLEGTNLDLSKVSQVNPGHIVIFSEQPQLMLDSGVLNDLGPRGYSLVHFSDGYLLYRRGVYVRQAYLIFRRNGWAGASDKNSPRN